MMFRFSHIRVIAALAAVVFGLTSAAPVSALRTPATAETASGLEEVMKALKDAASGVAQTFGFGGLEEAIDGPATAWITANTNNRLSEDGTNDVSLAWIAQAKELGANMVTFNPAIVGAWLQSPAAKPWLKEHQADLQDLEGEELMWKIMELVAKQSFPEVETSIELPPTDAHLFKLVPNANRNGHARVPLEADNTGRPLEGYSVLTDEVAALLTMGTLTEVGAAGEKALANSPSQALPEIWAEKVKEHMVSVWLAKAIEIAQWGAQAAGYAEAKVGETANISGNANVKVGNTADLEPWLGKELAREIGAEVTHKLRLLGIGVNYTLGFTAEDTAQSRLADYALQSELDAVAGIDLLDGDASVIAADVTQRLSSIKRPNWEEVKAGKREADPIVATQGRLYANVFLSRVLVRAYEEDMDDDFAGKHENTRTQFTSVSWLLNELAYVNPELPELENHGTMLIAASTGNKPVRNPEGGKHKVVPEHEFAMVSMGSGERITPTNPRAAIVSFNEWAAEHANTDEKMQAFLEAKSTAQKAYAHNIAAHGIGATDEQRRAAALEPIAQFVGRPVELGGTGDVDTARIFVQEILDMMGDEAFMKRMNDPLYYEGVEKFVGPHMGGIAQAEDALKELQEVQQLNRMSELIRYATWADIHDAKSGHQGGSSSWIEVGLSLYARFMNVDPSQTNWPLRDRFILSKGHTAPALYEILAALGVFPRDQINLRQTGSLGQGHPDMNVTPGVEYSTGALGYGVLASWGQAISMKQQGLKTKAVSVAGDGEIQGGGFWEGLLQARQLGLDNSIVIIDANKHMQNKPTEAATSVDADKLANMAEQADAHVIRVTAPGVLDTGAADFSEANEAYLLRLQDALDEAWSTEDGRPKVIIVDGIKGRGVTVGEDNFVNGSGSFHGKPTNDEQFEQVVRELAERVGIDGAAERPVPDLRADLDRALAEATREFQQTFVITADEKDAVAVAHGLAPASAEDTGPAIGVVPPSPTILQAPNYEVGDNVATRVAFGATLKALAELPAAVAVDGVPILPRQIVTVDPSNLVDSTGLNTARDALGGIFSADNPAGLSVELGITESFGFEAAKGMASMGKIPVVATFGRFAAIGQRAIVHAKENGLPMVVVGTHVGVNPGQDGPSNQGIEGLAVANANEIPTFEASDAVSAVEATLRAIAVAQRDRTPVYLQLHRNAWPVLDRSETARKRGFVIWKRPIPRAVTGKKKITLVASGATVPEAIKAAELLEAQDVAATVVGIESTSMIMDMDNRDIQELLDSTEGPIYTVVDGQRNSLTVPLGQAVLASGLRRQAAVAPQVQIVGRGLDINQLGSGNPAELFALHRINAASIAEDAVQIIDALADGSLPLDLPRGVGLEEGEETFTAETTIALADGTPWTVPVDGVAVDGLFYAGTANFVPDAVIDLGLASDGQDRLIVPPAVINGSQQVFVQRGLLDARVVEGLRVQGVAVQEFLVSEELTFDGDRPVTVIAAVQPDSETEARFAGYGTLVNLYGSTPAGRPTTLSALATLIHVAHQNGGLLRVEAITVDDYSGAIAIDLSA